ncbi:MAG: penicillin acylase family protein [Gemmatimonadaceae bacterium]
MNSIRFVVLAAGLGCAAMGADDGEVARWERQARDATITRDDWGIPHIRGKTDADAVFGLMYAQAEDDFNRVETNFINALGRLAEAEGEGAVYRDLRMKLFVDPDSMQAKFATSPGWLKELMVAWADGLNYFLHKNADVKPRVIQRFEPWMALTFSEGSIGGDIERVSIPSLRTFYGADSTRRLSELGDSPEEPRGSNGIAIAPANTAAGRALLLINPHTSFFFRAEVHVSSDAGLDAYGAVTWGQFFVYQGFNERAGWMHTSSGVDNIDEYAETVIKRGSALYYLYEGAERPLIASKITVPYRDSSGSMAHREFTVYRTHHGPIVRQAGDKWISVRLMQEPVKALTQSYARTKAKDLAAFRATMELHTNSSNNTVYANADGDIAYWHANFVPKRDTAFDWSRPVDGSSRATEWGGLHSIGESPNVFNPPNGWVYNTNNYPYSAAGPHSPQRERYPAYMDRNSENPRGLHAIRLLQGRKDFTLGRLVEAAYDSYLTAFEALLPPLIADYDRAAATPLKTSVSEQLELLRAWDLRWSESSVPTTLAIFWADTLQQLVASAATSARMSAYDFAITRATPQQRLQALADASVKLTADFASWKTPWGRINRFQRLNGDIVQPFSDAAPSIPVGFTSARWGSLASFGARPYPGTKKWYGTSGNSFVAVVEFGDSVRARAVSAGGQSGAPASPHFNDQALRYSKGDLREVYFYPSQLRGHTRRRYHPGR